MEENLSECRNCKSEVPKKARRCPYCGILNPTVTIPEILITMVGVIAVMAIYTIFFN
ncbi:MAG: hypothetical protein U9R39_04295 [Campylobacterota bacterium]|nr:hypothetical protein [Campylobacterota bacterium]